MKLIFQRVLFLFATILSSNVYSQETFQKEYGTVDLDFCSNVILTPDSGYAVLGSLVAVTLPGNGYILIKTNMHGDVIWSTIMTVDGGMLGYSLEPTFDGGYIFTGTFQPDINQYGHISLVKTDSTGNLEWAKMYGTSDYDLAFKVAQTSDSGFVIFGNLDVMGAHPKMIMVRTNSLGDTLWTRIFVGLLADESLSGIQTNDGGFIILGNKVMNFSGGYDIYMIKTDSSGNILWSKLFGGSEFDAAFDILQTQDGGYIISGCSNSFGAGGMDGYLIKTDSSGNVTWSTTFGGPLDDYGYEIQQTSDGGYVIASSTYSFGNGGEEAMIIRIDTSGSFLWSRMYGYPWDDNFHSVVITPDNGFILAGTTSDSLGVGELYVVKTDSLGFSGCNESIPPLIIFSPETNATIPVDSVVSGVNTSTVVMQTWNAVQTITYCASVGLHSDPENAQFLIGLFPNPGTDLVTITFPTQISAGTLDLFDMRGSLVLHSVLNNESESQINVSEMIPGIYVVRAFDGHDFFTAKLMVE